MTPNASTVVKLVTILAEAFGRKVSDPMLDAYRLGLKDVSAECLMECLPQLLQSAKFMPTPAEIREAAGAKAGFISAKDRPTLAWVDVRRAMSTVGGYDSPNFEDKVINATIRAMGGWVDLCEASTADLVWREKDFVRTYTALAATELADEQTKRLAGITEKANGSAIAAPVVEIGCMTSGGFGNSRRIEVIETKRITSQSKAVANLAGSVGVAADKEESAATTSGVRSRDEQIEILKAMKDVSR